MLKHLPSEFSTFLDHILTLDYYTKPDYEVGLICRSGYLEPLYPFVPVTHTDACGLSVSAADVSV